MPARDFLQAVQGKSLSERERSLRVGDYIDMDVNRFKKWPVSRGNQRGDLNSLPVKGQVRVKVIKITGRLGLIPIRILVSAGSVKKEIMAALFTTYKLER